MGIANFDLPSIDTAEITLIGTAGGYGESIVVHLGDQNWAIVDSCRDPLNGSCLPLEYLQSIGVKVEEQVKLLVCTHWHNDHIKGLAELFTECEQAQFCFAPCTDVDKFLLFVNIEQLKTKDNQSTTEFAKCLDIATQRNTPIIRAIQDRTLLKLNIGDNTCSIFSLSPSDATLKAYDIEVSTLIENVNSMGRIVIEGPNSKSVALLLTIGKHNAILGADLEVCGNKFEGWTNILDNSQVINRDHKASFFKIPHHGSSNGYDLRVWDELLTKNAVGNLTPYNRSKLPKIEMLSVYSGHTSNLYSTSDSSSAPKTKKRDRSIEKAIREIRPSLAEDRYTKGIVRSRISLNDASAEWVIDTFGPAYHVNPTIE
jgi:beta-lactamase superfamily II metal-dependent hydrolase